MRKMKLFAIMVVTILLGSGLISLVAAQDVTLDGDIKAEFEPGLNWIINCSYNLPLQQEKDILLENIEGNLTANVTLCIDFELDEMEDLAFPRYLILRTSVVYSDRARFGMSKINLFHPVENQFDIVQIDGEKNNDTIEIPLTKINSVNFSKVSSEKITVWIWTMGVLPGKVSYPLGESENIYYSILRPVIPKFIGLHVVDLTFNYLTPL